jgi:hypothetical protein
MNLMLKLVNPKQGLKEFKASFCKGAHHFKILLFPEFVRIASSLYKSDTAT